MTMDVHMDNPNGKEEDSLLQNSRPGNVAFSKILVEQAVRYNDLSRTEKPIVVFQLIKNWKEQGGRFVISGKEGEEGFAELPEKQVRKYVSQALRQLAGAPSPLVGSTEDEDFTIHAQQTQKEEPGRLVMVNRQQEQQQEEEAIPAEHTMELKPHRLAATTRRISTTFDYTKRENLLHGRSPYVDQLQTARREMSCTGFAHRLVILTGPSGMGKTALAHHALSTEGTDNTLLLVVKCEQPFVNSISMGSCVLLVALNEFAGSLQFRPRAEERKKQYQAYFRQEYEDTQQNDGTGGVRALPWLPFAKLNDWLADNNEKDASSKMQETSLLSQSGEQPLKRQAFATTIFLRAVLTVERCSLTFLLDDVQWIDEASLDVLSTIWTLLPPSCADDDVCGILYVATDRTEGSPALLSAAAEAGVPAECIPLPPLDRASISALLGSSLNVPTRDISSLCDFLFEHTRGNAGYVCELLRSFQEERVLHDSMDDSWHCDDAAARVVSSDSHSLLDLFAQRVRELPEQELKTLQYASCLGSHLDVDILQCLVGQNLTGNSNEMLKSHLSTALEHHLLVWNQAQEKYRFAHDGIQQALYDTMDPSTQEATHLKIGKAIWRTLEQADNDATFERRVEMSLSHILKARHLLQDPMERTMVAALCLRAGENAVRSVGYKTSAAYLNHAILLLGPAKWKQQNYELCLRLHNVGAEVSYITGKFDRVETLVKDVQRNAKCKRDTWQALSTHACTLGAMGSFAQAITVCREVLNELGVPLRPQPSQYVVNVEVRRTNRLLRGKGLRSVVLMPLMSDRDMLQAMTFLNLLVWPCWMTNASLLVLVVCRMVQFSMEHGLCAASAVGFSWYGLIVCQGGKHVEEGYQMGQIAIDILQLFPGDAWLARVYAAFYGCVSSWKEPVKSCAAPLKRAYHVGLGTGDLEFAMLNGCMHMWNNHEAWSLAVLDAECSTLSTRMDSFGLLVMVQFIYALWQLVQNLRDENAEQPQVLAGPTFDAESCVASDPSPQLLGWVRFYSMLLGLLFNDYDLAERWSRGLESVHDYMYGAMDAAVVLFYHALTLLLRWEHLTWRQKRKTLRYIRTIRHWALRSPPNFLSKLLFLEAELFRAKGNMRLAITKFQSAILHARADNFTMQQAMVHERLANLHLELGEPSFALENLKRGSELYSVWGGKAKVKRLTKEIDRVTEMVG